MSQYAISKHSLSEVKIFMQIKALERNVQKQYSNLSSKENKNWDKCMLCASSITKLSYLFGATVNSHENVTCKEDIFLNL